MRKAVIPFLFLFLFSCSPAVLNHDFFLHSSTSLFPRENFIQFVIRLEAIICQPDPITGEAICKAAKARSSGSGFIIKRNEIGSYVVTAEHVCNITPPSNIIITSIKSKILDLRHTLYEFKIIKQDRENDICLAFVKGLKIGKNLSIAKRPPREGEKIYNLAAPDGFFKKNIVALFEGRFIGTNKNKDYYSLFVKPGSSGSVVLNHDGQVIGIVCMKRIGLPIALGPKFSILRKFLLTNLK